MFDTRIIAGLGVGVAAAAFSAVGLAQHDVTAQQHDFALTAAAGDPIPVADYNPADTAHAALVDAQVAQDHSLFDNDVALQQSIYYFATEAKTDGGLGLDSGDLFPGNSADPENSIFNDAFSRFTEANLVGQAIQQAQLDHLLGVNQTLGTGGYETAIGHALHSDLSDAGIPATGALHDDVAALANPADTFSAFTAQLTKLQLVLDYNALFDLTSAFMPAAPSAAADAVDLPF